MKTRKIAYLGMLMALALVLSYVESLIPFAVGIPSKAGAYKYSDCNHALYSITHGDISAMCIPCGTFRLYVWKCVQHHIFTGRLYTKLYRYVPA